MVKANFSKTLHSQESNFILNIDLRIKKGEFVTIYGPSGAGKSTILRIIAGLQKVDNGLIEVDGHTWVDTNNKIILPPRKRSIGLVFQEYALFPNLTVEENIKFGVRDTPLFQEMTELMALGDLLNRKPNTLSGGQQQRVALARSLITQPSIIMLDEPMAALDHSMRNQIQDYLLAAHKKLGLTTIMVSHDVGEIFKLSSRVIKLENGNVIRDGLPEEVFFSKETSGRFQFIGEVLELSKEDVIFVIVVLIGNQLVKVVAEEEVANSLKVGEKVLVTSKAFNPIIQKLE